MKFLVASGGFIDHRFGIMTTPAHKGVIAGVKAGMWWAADNQCFTKTFDAEVFTDWLETMEPYRNTCLFVSCPDVVGDAVATLKRFADRDHYLASCWPVAFVAQDGQEHLELPEGFGTLFIGGSTGWKMGEGAITCIKRAQALGKRIHIGRVNWWKRYQHFAGMEGSYEWTCDGTRHRFEGIGNTAAAWLGYYTAPRQLHLPVPDSDCGG